MACSLLPSVFPGRSTQMSFHIGPKSQSPRRKSVGLALVEVIVALSLLTLVIVSSTQAFIQANRESAIMRLMTAARGIVQRNIDTALTVAWTSSLEPGILALTPSTGTL